MHESYAETLMKRGRAQVWEESIAAGRAEGRAEVVCEVQAALLLLGRRRFGEPSPSQRERLAAIQDLGHLSTLAYFLRRSSDWDDLLRLPADASDDA